MLYQNNWFWCLEPKKIYFVVISRLISEGIFNPSTKKVKNTILYFFNLGWKFENSDFAHLFEEETKLKITSEIKPPLSAIQQKKSNKKFWHIFDQIWRKKGLIVHFPPIVHIAKNQWMKTHYSFCIKVITLMQFKFVLYKKAFMWLFF